MVAWHPNKALAKLIAQYKAKNPGTEVVYTIADDAHASTSDHAKDRDGTVDAGDFMPGPNVTDAELDDFAEVLRIRRDPRIKYVIRRQRIFAGNDGPEPWVWRSYSGKYHAHTHVSTREANEDDGSDWALTRPVPPRRELKRGDKGADVKVVQKAVKVPQDGDFGPRTENGVKALQRKHKLTADGIVGPKTWVAVDKENKK